MSRARRVIAALFVSVLVEVAAHAQDGPATTAVPEEFAERLTALNPHEPGDYLILGEDILARASDDQEIALARHLFALAFEHARLAGDRPGVQASACIALADTARFERDRRWLWSIARLIDPRYAAPDWSRSVDRVVTEDAALLAATTLGLIRAGEGVRARELLKDQRVREVFVWYSGLLTGAGPGDVLSLLDTQAARWPCPECRNARVVRSAPAPDAPTVRCHTCRGNPGWELTPSALLATLRFESRVLAGVQRSWGAQLAADLGEPLRDPDPGAVVRALGVDASLCLFRDGVWVSPTLSSEDAPPDPDEGDDRP